MAVDASDAHTSHHSVCCEAFPEEARLHRIRLGLIPFQLEEYKNVLQAMEANPTIDIATMKEIVTKGNLVVLDAGLGGGAVKLPGVYCSSYGFRKRHCVDGDSSTWEGETDALSVYEEILLLWGRIEKAKASGHISEEQYRSLMAGMAAAEHEGESCLHSPIIQGLESSQHSAE